MVQNITAKLENCVNSIEREVIKLNDQVEAQNKDIISAVKDVTHDFLVSYY
jgi:hypothetical protein